MSQNVLQKKMAGKFIVLDGPDGCGKSTQTKLLAEYLTAQGVDVLSISRSGQYGHRRKDSAYPA